MNEGTYEALPYAAGVTAVLVILNVWPLNVSPVPATYGAEALNKVNVTDVVPMIIIPVVVITYDSPLAVSPPSTKK